MQTKKLQSVTINAWLGLMALVGGACSVGEGGGGSLFDTGNGIASGPRADTDGLGVESAGTEGDGDTDGMAGDETGGEPSSDDDAKEYIEEAKKEFPTYLDLHEKVIQRTCTPFNNVCHNNREYPDLRTPQGMLDRLGQPCNIVELHDDPEEVFNGCEPEGDTLRFTDGANAGWSTRIGFVEFTDDGAGNVLSAQIYLEDNVPAGMAVPGQFESVIIERLVDGQMLSVGTLTSQVSYTAGANAVQISDWATLEPENQTMLESEIREGDANRDGIFGSSMPDAMRQIAPGDPWNSYLLQRLQGTVPGSPMPLANQPLSASEIVAIACWIEGAGDPSGAEVDSAIDYDNCLYAEEFAAPPGGGGATLSAHVQPVFDTYCNAGGCHGSQAPAAGLDLSPGKARDNLLADSTQNPGVPRVTPLNPTNSYLMKKVTENGVQGVQMPPGGPALGENEVEIIRTWIIQGAPDN